jgi:hypothetical protein
VMAEAAKLPRKGTVKVKVTAKRNPAFKGEIALTCSPLPQGIKAMPIKLAPAVAEQELVLSAAPDAAVGAIKSARVEGRATVGNEKFSKRIPLAGIVVE